MFLKSIIISLWYWDSSKAMCLTETQNNFSKWESCNRNQTTDPYCYRVMNGCLHVLKMELKCGHSFWFELITNKNHLADLVIMSCCCFPQLCLQVCWDCFAPGLS